MFGQELERAEIIELNQKHAQERAKNEEDFKEEMSKYETFWQEKINGFSEKANEMLEQAKEKQRENLGARQTELREAKVKLDRMPPEVLNIEFQINKLAKEQRYHEAHNLKKKLEKLVSSLLNPETPSSGEERNRCSEETRKTA